MNKLNKSLKIYKLNKNKNVVSLTMLVLQILIRKVEKKEKNIALNFVNTSVLHILSVFFKRH